MTNKDRSNYLRGLLIISRMDYSVSHSEKLAMIRISKILGFDPHFCSEAVEELTTNRHISETPPVFSEKGIAKSFLTDSLMLVLADGNLHLNELRWIRNVAKANDIEKQLLFNLVENVKKTKTANISNYYFEVEKFVTNGNFIS